MWLPKWYRKRHGILIESAEPEFRYVSTEERRIVIRSCLSLESVLAKIREITPPPSGYMWYLMDQSHTRKRGSFYFAFRLMERNDYEY